MPLGVAIALAMPRKGPWVSVCLVLMALPLLIPWNVVGAMWNIFALPDIGLLGRMLNGLGIDYNYTQQPLSAWATLIAMDVWHWTSLVVLLAYAGLSAIPDAYYQAARIDGASSWAIFRYIQLPKMKRVLTIAVLLRFMDSFNIYTEPFVLTGGGPGNATTLLSIDLVKIALGQFDLGPAAAMSIIYFLIILSAVVDLLHGDDARARRRDEQAAAGWCRRSTSSSCCCRSTGSSACRSRRPTRSSAASRCGRTGSRWRTTARSSPTRPGTAATSTR